jgi:hypothetical protein
MLVKIAIAVLVIIVVAFGGIIYNDYLGQTARAESVNTAIQNDINTGKIVSKGTDKINREIIEIDQKIDETREAIEKEDSLLPEKIDSNEIIREILVQGKADGVSIIPLSTREWTKTQVNKIDYQVLKINLEIKGQQTNVVHFIRQMQDSAYQTMVLESVTLKRPQVPEDTDIIADMNLSIYAR